MKNFTLKSILSAAALTLAAGVSLNAAAEGLEETFVGSGASGVQTISLQYLSSDLATDEGRDRLHSRIAKAAREVCGPVGARAAGGLRIASHNKQCAEDAVQAAMSQVDSGQFAANLN